MTVQGWLGRVTWGAAAAMKNAVVSATPRYVTVWRGPARGATLRTSYRHGLRMILGLYESELNVWVRRYVHAGDVCYDLGAGGGYYTFAFARLAAPGVVYCVDLNAQFVEQLKTLAARNASLGSVVSVHQMRIGGSHIEATATSIDTLVYERAWKRPHVMKLDVEGDELDALRGSTRVLTEHRPRLIIEVHSASLERDCRELLEQIGYRVTVVQNRALMAEHAFRAGHNRWICAE